MSVDIGRAIEEGGRRTVARNGLYLVAISWVLGVIGALFSNTVSMGAFQQVPGGPGGMPGGPGGMPIDPSAVGPSLGLSPGVAGLLSFVVSLLGLVVGAAAVRTFVTDDTETLPGSRFTHNLGWLLVNLFIGYVVFAIVVGIGFFLLVFPGVFLLVSLWFWAVPVAVEDENFVDGFSTSWGLTKGNRIMLFITGIVVLFIGLLISIVFGIAAFAGGWIGLLINQVGSAFATVFVLATTARTYVQLTAEASVDVTEESVGVAE